MQLSATALGPARPLVNATGGACSQGIFWVWTSRRRYARGLKPNRRRKRFEK